MRRSEKTNELDTDCFCGEYPQPKGDSMRKAIVILFAMVFSLAAFAQDTQNKDAKSPDAKPAETKTTNAPLTNKKIPANSKVFLAPMGGFEEDLRAAIQSKKVPVVLVTDKEQADYVIAGTSDTEKASTAK